MSNDSTNNFDNFRIIFDNIIALLISPNTWQLISQSNIVTSYSYFLIQATDICRKYHSISILDIVDMEEVKLLWEEFHYNHHEIIKFWKSIVDILSQDSKTQNGKINLNYFKKPFQFTSIQEKELLAQYQEITRKFPKLNRSTILFDVVIIMGIQNLTNFIAPFFKDIPQGDKIYQVINQIVMECHTHHQSKNLFENGIINFMECVRNNINKLATKIISHSQENIISSQELLASSHESIKNIENLDVERIKKDKFYNQKTNQSFNNVFRQFKLTSNQSIPSISGGSDSDIKKDTSVSPKRKYKPKKMPMPSHKENPSILTDYSEDDRLDTSPNISGNNIQSNMPSFTDLQDDLTILQNDSNSSSEELNKLTHHLMQESHTNHECKSRIPSTEFDFSDAMSVLNDYDLLNILLKDKK